MKRIVSIVFAVLSVVGCSRKTDESVVRHEPCVEVREAASLIMKLERSRKLDGSTKVGERMVDVRGMSADDFRKVLSSVPGKQVHVWMPGERDWLVVWTDSTNSVSLADAMDDFASDTNCFASVAEVFASYVGTRDEIMPAFEAKLEGDVVPQWFVTRNIPEMKWLDATDIDSDIRKMVLGEIRSMQVVRRVLLEGNMLVANAIDDEGEKAAIEKWAKAALRSPNDSMLRERIGNLNRNAKGFLEVGKVLQALKCYETIALITPNDAVAVYNFGMCLKKIGKLDVAEKALERAKKLSKGQ